VLCWVPSHVGIPGNDQVDRMDKEACDLIPNNYPIPYKDYIPALREWFTAKWQHRWNAIDNFTQMRLIKPKIGKWSFFYRRSRQEETVVAPLRIGHTRPTKGHLFAKEVAPQCDECHVIMDMEHILVDCSKYDACRRTTFPKLNVVPAYKRLAYILSESDDFDAESLFVFLRQTRLMHQI
jgi:hypothetical protein